MKITKALLSFVLVLMISVVSFGQEKMDKKELTAKDKVVKLNDELTAVDANLALTAAQTERLIVLYDVKIANIENLKAEGASEDQIKQAKEKYDAEVKNILTPEQEVVRAKLKAKKKAEKSEVRMEKKASSTLQKTQ